ADSPIVGVEAPVEADLQLDASMRDRSERAVDPLQALVDRLLAEDSLAGRSGLLDDLGVGVGGRADRNGLDVGACDERAVVGHGLRDAAGCGAGLGPLLGPVG